MQKSFKQIFFGLFLVSCILYLAPEGGQASIIDDLRNDITDRNKKIAEIEAEIALYEEQIEKTQGEKQTLQNKVNELDATRRKLSSEISATENKIYSTNLTIEQLVLEISEKEDSISNQNLGLKESLRKINRESSSSLVEIILAHDSISDFWLGVESIERLQNKVRLSLDELRFVKKILEEKKGSLEKNKNELVGLRSKLSDKKAIADGNKRQTTAILDTTKNKEANYKKLLNDRKKLKEEIEAEIRDFEARLKIEIDPNALPDRDKGVLAWPVKKVFITQYFGNTPFAKTHQHVYGGKGHNGIDLRASVGTGIYSAESGIVDAVGDTDLGCPYGSYGRWVLVKHFNGLSTLYAHLSLIKVSPGQKLKRGDLVGYSGNTGYSTGPHLHFTVYASQGVRVGELTRKDGTKSKCGKMPLSPWSGYLNPQDYL